MKINYFQTYNTESRIEPKVYPGQSYPWYLSLLVQSIYGLLSGPYSTNYLVHQIKTTDICVGYILYTYLIYRSFDLLYHLSPVEPSYERQQHCSASVH